jgi:hypothetical protein
MKAWSSPSQATLASGPRCLDAGDQPVAEVVDPGPQGKELVRLAYLDERGSRATETMRSQSAGSRTAVLRRSQAVTYDGTGMAGSSRESGTGPPGASASGSTPDHTGSA